MFRTMLHLSSILVFTAPLIHIAGYDNPFFLNSRLAFPPYLSTFFSWLLYLVYMLFLFFSINKLKRIFDRNLTIRIFPLFLSYCILLVFAIASFSDVSRYVLLTMMVIIVPSAVYFLLNTENEYIEAIKKYSVFYVVFSFVFVVLNYNPGMRSTGMLGNPNIFSATLLFHLAFLLEYSNRIRRIRYNYVIITIITSMIFMSGSRSALLVAFLILLPSLLKNKLNFSIICAFMLASLFYFGGNELEFLTSRFSIDAYENVASQSGRRVIWESAVYYIKQDYLVGWGMDSPQKLLDTGNVHSSYYRIMLMIGIPLSILSFISMSAFLLFITFSRNISELNIFIVSFFILSLGEDFLVGIGSAMFYYFIISIPLLLKFRRLHG
ncbi:O-antigen ligase family protein [Vibrio vulnificus]|uniref:O-antigen ligase family protein n=1 Tax=Vibrio vulnificus TaxID=672 RepID=UPI003ED97B60